MADYKITPEIVALFKRAIAIEEDGLEDLWEDDGGARSEYLDACTTLKRLLGVKVWEPSPLDAEAVMDLSNLPEHMLGGWARAVQLRRALEKAAGL